MSFLLIALAVASTSITISKTLIFKSFREKVPGSWLRKLLQCSYCLSYWLSFFAIYLLLPWSNYLNLIIKTMAMVTIAAIATFPILLYLKELDKHETS